MSQVYSSPYQRLSNLETPPPSPTSFRKVFPSHEKMKPVNTAFDPLILRKLIESGHDLKLLSGIPLPTLFLPEKGCHLEVERHSDGTALSVASVKNHSLKSNKGTFHVMGIQHGIRIELYQNGNTKSIAQWINGKQNNIATSYYINGQVESISSWQNNKANGFSTSFYENGIRRNSCQFIDNKCHGIMESWDRCGTPLAPTYWINGNQVSEEIYLKESWVKKSFSLKKKTKKPPQCDLLRINNRRSF